MRGPRNGPRTPPAADIRRTRTRALPGRCSARARGRLTRAMSWKLKKKAQGLVASEEGVTQKDWGGRVRVALVYPNTYAVGMSNLGFQTIYDHLNALPHVVCERVFFPDAEDLDEYGRTGTPPFSLESQRPLVDFDLIGFSITYEGDYVNTVRLLRMAGIPVRAVDRGPGDPVIMMGGVCAFSNPEPVAAFMDVIVVGEGEEVVGEIVDAWTASGPADDGRRGRFVERLKPLSGIYVPGAYRVAYGPEGHIEGVVPIAPDVPAVVVKRSLRDVNRFETRSSLKTPKAEYGHMQVLEEHGVEVSISSLRADSLTEELVASLKRGGHRTLTMAPEAGTERLRGVIRKAISDAQLYEACELLRRYGIPNLKCYFMIGLPTETREDVEAIADLAARLLERLQIRGPDGHPFGKLTLSISSFVPKPWTPFQWASFDDARALEAKLDIIKQAARRLDTIRVVHENPREAALQALLARGDRRVADFIELAAGLDGDWRRALREWDGEAAFFTRRVREVTETMPWDHFDVGVKKPGLRREWERAWEAATPAAVIG